MLSRVAECLLWMSRYIERAENNARLLEVNLQLMLDFESQSEATVRQHWAPIINSLEDQELFHEFYQKPTAIRWWISSPSSRKIPTRFIPCLARARENARSVREQISSEMWEHLNSLYLFIRSEEARELFRTSSYQFYQRILYGSFQIHRHHRCHDDPRRGLGLHPVGKIPGARRLHLSHPRREVSHPPAQRRARRRHRG